MITFVLPGSLTILAFEHPTQIIFIIKTSMDGYLS